MWTATRLCAVVALSCLLYFAVLTQAQPLSALPKLTGIRFEYAVYSFAANAGSARLTVWRQGNSSGLATVQYQTMDGFATKGSDYTFTSGVLVWADGDSTPATVTVPLIAPPESANSSFFDRSFTVLLFNNVGPPLTGPALAVVIITAPTKPAELDPNKVDSFGWDAPVYTSSTSAAAVVVAVLRQRPAASGAPASLAVSVRFATSDGTALAGTHYRALSGTLNYAAADYDPRILSIALLNANVGDSTSTERRFYVRLLEPSGAVLSTQSQVAVVLSPVQLTAGLLAFTKATMTVPAQAGFAVLWVTRTGGSSGVASAGYLSAASQSATAGVDYGEVRGLLTWAAGDSSNKRILVPILNRSTAADPSSPAAPADRVFSVALYTPSGALGTVTDPRLAAVTISGGMTPAQSGDWTDSESGVTLSSSTLPPSSSASSSSLSATETPSSASAPDLSSSAPSTTSSSSLSSSSASSSSSSTQRDTSTLSSTATAPPSSSSSSANAATSTGTEVGSSSTGLSSAGNSSSSGPRRNAAAHSCTAPSFVVLLGALLLAIECASRLAAAG